MSCGLGWTSHGARQRTWVKTGKIAPNGYSYFGNAQPARTELGIGVLKIDSVSRRAGIRSEMTDKRGNARSEHPAALERWGGAVCVSPAVRNSSRAVACDQVLPCLPGPGDVGIGGTSDTQQFWFMQHDSVLISGNTERRLSGTRFEQCKNGWATLCPEEYKCIGRWHRNCRCNSEACAVLSKFMKTCLARWAPN